MSEEEAVALAAKREAHKSKYMTDKEWRAVNDSVKGWHVALVDSAQGLWVAEQDAKEKMRRAVRCGDMTSFLDAAYDASMASLRRQIDATPTSAPSA